MLRSATSMNKITACRHMQKYYGERTKKTKTINKKRIVHAKQKEKQNKPKNATLAMNESRQFKVTFK